VGSANTELVLAAVSAWERRDKEALLDCFSPDFEFRLSGQIPDQPLAIHGHEEYSRFFDSWLESWESFTFAAAEVNEVASDRVLMKTVQHGVTREGVSADRVVWFVADISAGKIVRYQAFVDEAAATAAAHDAQRVQA
jgi:ketosteroid isomerase-like protein